MSSIDTILFHPAHTRLFLIGIGYLAAIIACEACIALGYSAAALVGYILILIVLVSHSASLHPAPMSAFLLSLMSIPILRMVSFTLPLDQISPLWWPMILAVPLGINTILIVRQTHLTLALTGIHHRGLGLQLLVGASGILLGWIQYQVLPSAANWAPQTNTRLALAVLGGIITTGFLEEWIFRGVIQTHAQRTFGPVGWVFPTIICMALSLGQQSLRYVIVVGIICSLFSYIVLRSYSIIGISIAHGLANCMIWFILPNLDNTALTFFQQFHLQILLLSGLSLIVAFGFILYRSSALAHSIHAESVTQSNENDNSFISS